MHDYAVVIYYLEQLRQTGEKKKAVYSTMGYFKISMPTVYRRLKSFRKDYAKHYVQMIALKGVVQELEKIGIINF